MTDLIVVGIIGLLLWVVLVVGLVVYVRSGR